VTNKYSLPVSWVTTLGEIFTSNRYWAKFERIFELGVYCDGIYNHTFKESCVDGDVLEVSILFCFRAYILVYFAALDNDPLYLFTEEKIENYLSHFFEQHMKPALLYLQETFSPPIGLNLWIPALTDATNPDDIKMKCPNFKYQMPMVSKTSSSKAWVSITEPFKKNPSHKNSWMTTLNIKVPKMRNHSFWERDSDNLTSVSWEIDNNNAIEFEVSRWGPSHQHANYHATQRAKDIIRCIRLALTTGLPAHPTFIPSSSKINMQTCQVFQFGVKISKMWRQAERAFTDNTREFWEIALDKLRSFEVELPELQFLIKYYEVLFLFHRILITVILTYADRSFRGCDPLAYRPSSRSYVQRK
jgi:hypothetical protein